MLCLLIILTTFLGIATALSASPTILTPRQTFPACYYTCLDTPDLGGCEKTNNQCLCNNNAFINNIRACVLKHCSGEDITAAYDAAQAICLAAGVTLSVSGVSTTGATSTEASQPRPTSLSTTIMGSNEAGIPTAFFTGPLATPSSASSPLKGVSTVLRLDIFAGIAALALASWFL